jgi:hypothetical protein
LTAPQDIVENLEYVALIIKWIEVTDYRKD